MRNEQAGRQAERCEQQGGGRMNQSIQGSARGETFLFQGLSAMESSSTPVSWPNFESSVVFCIFVNL